MSYNSHLPIPKEVLDVPGFQGLTLTVYGVVKATTREQEMQQGYHIAVDGKPTPRSELPAPERAAAEALLKEKFPEHAAI